MHEYDDKKKDIYIQMFRDDLPKYNRYSPRTNREFDFSDQDFTGMTYLQRMDTQDELIAFAESI